MIILGLTDVQAQVDPNAVGYYEDALRFSSFERGGSARIQGLAGSGVALGGDISALTINPAGLGFFNKSVFTITPQYTFRDNAGRYQGNENISFTDNFAIGQIGVVIDLTKSDYEKGAFRGGALSFSFSKRNDFNERIEITGDNFNNSVVDYFVENAQGIPTNNFYGSSNEIVDPIGLGYDAFLFDTQLDCPDPLNCPDYERFFDFEPVNQREFINIKGNQREWNVGYGANISDQFYFGGKLGIATLRYSFDRKFTESDLDQQTDALQYVNLFDKLEIEGSGVNFSAGFIYRPINLVRFGLSFESPTIYSLEEKFQGSIETQFNNYPFFEDPNNPDNNFYLNYNNSNLLPGFFDYNLRTPLRLNFGTAVFAGKNGFITADVEYLDYRRSRISFESLDGDENADNSSINNIYDRTFNFRVGAEYRIDMFRVRGGYAHFGDPFKSNVNLVDQDRNRISGGFGMRFQDYYWDLSLTHDWYKEGYTLYQMSDGNSPAASIEKNITRLAATAGIYF